MLMHSRPLAAEKRRTGLRNFRRPIGLTPEFDASAINAVLAATT